jgi:hypothetical protein
MSHFSQIKTLIRDRQALVTALTKLELKPKVYDQPQALKGYYGDWGEYSAEIIVSGETMKARADMGFRWNSSTNVYDVIQDDYETGRRLGRDFFTHNLMRAYGNEVTRAKAAELSERLGECTITESSSGTVQTLRLTFAAHQNTAQIRR